MLFKTLAAKSRCNLLSDILFINSLVAPKRFLSGDKLKQTSLHDYHVSKGGKMVPFAGYSMPVQYGDGVISSHLFCRSNVVLFDVSHMLQTSIKGKDAVSFIESLTVCDVQKLNDNSGSLTVFTTDEGTIIDDLIVNKLSENELYVVSNAGCAQKDLQLMKDQEKIFKDQGKDVSVEVLEKSLIAVQGPQMKNLIQPLVDFDLSKMPFMTTKAADVGGIAGTRVTRCGYTGEDGVEIQVDNKKVVELADLLTNSRVECRLAGLAARDSLRLEAGLCLYGSDMDDTITPSEAGLLWLIGKRRRETGDFPGAEKILAQIADKSLVRKRRVGLVVQGAPARHGAAISMSIDNHSAVGHVTSGGPSPSLKQNIAMAYVDADLSKVGTELLVTVRDRKYKATVTKMPFVPTNYYTIK